MITTVAIQALLTFNHPCSRCKVLNLGELSTLAVGVAVVTQSAWIVAKEGVRRFCDPDAADKIHQAQ